MMATSSRELRPNRSIQNGKENICTSSFGRKAEFPRTLWRLASGWRVGKQNKAREQASGVTEVGLVPPISAGKRYRVLGRHLDLTRIGRSRICAFNFVKCRVTSVSFNEGIEEGFGIVQDVHVS